ARIAGTTLSVVRRRWLAPLQDSRSGRAHQARLFRTPPVPVCRVWMAGLDRAAPGQRCRTAGGAGESGSQGARRVRLGRAAVAEAELFTTGSPVSHAAVVDAPAARSGISAARTTHVLAVVAVGWSALAFGAVYPWAYWPLAAVCLLAGILGLVAV